MLGRIQPKIQSGVFLAHYAHGGVWSGAEILSENPSALPSRAVRKSLGQVGSGGWLSARRMSGGTKTPLKSQGKVRPPARIEFNPVFCRGSTPAVHPSPLTATKNLSRFTHRRHWGQLGFNSEGSAMQRPDPLQRTEPRTLVRMLKIEEDGDS